ncbi:MAG: hypothetical protein HY424_03310 [Candidatus Levybacteria bacterium]|nr:hypothetical protein [Candidatus Levybacteria bacterium]
MNIKKLATSAVIGATLLSFMAPAAFASHRPSIYNSAKVRTNVVTDANTGWNKIEGRRVNGGDILTGPADSFADVRTRVNRSVLDCGCRISVKNHAYVHTDVDTTANSGWNTIRARRAVNDGNITTGEATATSMVATTVNTTITSD